MWSWALDVSETLAVDWETSSDSYSQLVHLNLAHNNFSIVPASLACLAVSVTRLNLSFNKYCHFSFSTITPFYLVLQNYVHLPLSLVCSINGLKMKQVFTLNIFYYFIMI